MDSLEMAVVNGPVDLSTLDTSALASLHHDLNNTHMAMSTGSQGASTQTQTPHQIAHSNNASGAEAGHNLTHMSASEHTVDAGGNSNSDSNNTVTAVALSAPDANNGAASNSISTSDRQQQQQQQQQHLDASFSSSHDVSSASAALTSRLPTSTSAGAGSFSAAATPLKLVRLDSVLKNITQKQHAHRTPGRGHNNSNSNSNIEGEHGLSISNLSTADDREHDSVAAALSGDVDAHDASGTSTHLSTPHKSKGRALSSSGDIRNNSTGDCEAVLMLNTFDSSQPPPSLASDDIAALTAAAAAAVAKGLLPAAAAAAAGGVSAGGSTKGVGAGIVARARAPSAGSSQFKPRNSKVFTTNNNSNTNNAEGTTMTSLALDDNTSAARNADAESADSNTSAAAAVDGAGAGDAGPETTALMTTEGGLTSASQSLSSSQSQSHALGGLTSDEYALFISKQVRSQFFSGELGLLKSFHDISTRLVAHKEREQRKKVLPKLLSHLRLFGLYFPIFSVNDEHHMIRRIFPAEAVVLNSRDKAPFLLWAEIETVPGTYMGDPSTYKSYERVVQSKYRRRVPTLMSAVRGAAGSPAIVPAPVPTVTSNGSGQGSGGNANMGSTNGSSSRNNNNNEDSSSIHEDDEDDDDDDNDGDNDDGDALALNANANANAAGLDSGSGLLSPLTAGIGASHLVIDDYVNTANNNNNNNNLSEDGAVAAAAGDAAALAAATAAAECAAASGKRGGHVPLGAAMSPLQNVTATSLALALSSSSSAHHPGTGASAPGAAGAAGGAVAGGGGDFSGIARTPLASPRQAARLTPSSSNILTASNTINNNNNSSSAAGDSNSNSSARVPAAATAAATASVAGSPLPAHSANTAARVAAAAKAAPKEKEPPLTGTAMLAEVRPGGRYDPFGELLEARTERLLAHYRDDGNGAGAAAASTAVTVGGGGGRRQLRPLPPPAGDVAILSVIFKVRGAIFISHKSTYFET